MDNPCEISFFEVMKLLRANKRNSDRLPSIMPRVQTRAVHETEGFVIYETGKDRCR